MGLAEPGDDEMCEVFDVAFNPKVTLREVRLEGSKAALVRQECNARPLHHCDQCQRRVCSTHWCVEAGICVDCQLIWELGIDEELRGGSTV